MSVDQSTNAGDRPVPGKPVRWRWAVWTVGSLAVLAIAVWALAEIYIARLNYHSNISAPAAVNMLFYSGGIHRKPGEEISFRFYGAQARLIASADIRLNNMGYFSRRDYDYARGPNEYRIVTIGGEQTASSVVNVSWPDWLEDELNRRDPSTRYKVFNIAWPDAGPEHYIRYWKEEAQKFDPDLVIVNYVETDFYRQLAGLPGAGGGPGTYKGIITKNKNIEYRVAPGPDGVAMTSVPHWIDHNPTSFRDPSMVPSRPYGFFATRAFMSDPKKIVALQEQVVSDMILGAEPEWAVQRLLQGRPIWIKVENRNFDPQPSAPVNRAQLVDFGTAQFGWIAQNIPNVLITHNFSHAERTDPFELTAQMMAKDPRIKVIDMRPRIPGNISEEEFRSWYIVPAMSEKWSEKGHMVFGGMMADLVQERKSQARAKQ